MAKQTFEIMVVNLETNDVESQWFSGGDTLNQINHDLDYPYEMDLQLTLENYLDHKFINAFMIEIKNERKVYELALNRLIGNYEIYDIIKRKYLIPKGEVANG